MPAPRAFNNFAYVRILWHPAEFFAYFVAGRHKHGEIAWPARGNVSADRSTGYRARRIDDFFNGEPFAVTQIVKAAAALQGAQRQYVRLREIVKYDHRLVCSDQLFDDDAADVSRSACNEDFHSFLSLK